MIGDVRPALSALRRQWFAVALLYCAALGAGYGLMVASGPEAQRWLLQAAVAMCVQLGVLWWALRFNHPPWTGTLFPSLGLANWMTSVRGLLVSLMAGFLLGAEPLGWLAWAPAVLYMAERVIDFLDGLVARYTRRESQLGAILDMEFDGLGILIAVGLAIQYGHLPVWYWVLGLGRQLFILGLWIRRRLNWPVLDLQPSDHRRLIAGFQTGFISIVLWPLWTDQVALYLAWLFAGPLIFSFGRDWLVVSTTVDVSSAHYQRIRQQTKKMVEQWLPPCLRLVGAGLTVWLVWQAGMPWLALVAAASLLLGVLGRVGAVCLTFLAAWHATQMGLQLDNGLLLFCAVAVVHLGSGRWAGWQPEEYYLHAKLGTRAEAAE
ncbi:MAG: CDP-alcohol phosphatidyltransferase family protein [Caldilinea sp.]